MSRKDRFRLTADELVVMQMLWETGEVSLSEAHEAMRQRGAKVAYTTVQTRLDRLVEKKVVAKSAARPAKYAAAIEPDQVGEAFVDLLLRRVSGAVPLFAHLVQDPTLTRDDLAEMKRLIAAAEARLEETES